MDLSPSRYDVSELREMAGVQLGGRPAEEPDRRRVSPVSEADILQGPVKQPYLERIPMSAEAVATILDWLDYLLGRAGASETLWVLGYYRDLNWYTETVEHELRRYLSGLEPPVDAASGSLTANDHKVSLGYVTRLSTH